MSTVVATSAATAAASSAAITTAPAAGSPAPLHPGAALTNADNGKTVHVAVGVTIDLALTAAGGFQNWVVATPNSAVLAPTVNPAAAAARGVTLRAFRAVGAGQADITATDRPACQPGQACPQLIQAFKVTVVVGG